jgi:hypothetical protein
LNTNDINNIYSALTMHLSSTSLGWLVRDVEFFARQGTEIRSDQPEDDVNLMKGIPAGSIRGRMPPRTVNRELSAEDRLNLLIDAIDSSICGPVFLLEAIFKLMPELNDSGGKLTLAREDFESDGISFTRNDFASRIQLAHKLRNLLLKLRDELDVTNTI